MADILRATQSVCPVCLSRIGAAYVARDNGVFLEKHCPEHGAFSAEIWADAAGFDAWRYDAPAQAPIHPAKPAARGCPYDCGLCSAHSQASCCVLLEVTSRCNLRCPVCFASSGEEHGARGAEDPTLQTIAGWYDMLMEHGGPFNIQLSGGEPTLRDDLPAVIALGRQKGFSFFQLNTNGLRIAREPAYLQALVEAGLNTVFLQFDSLDGEACKALRGVDLLAQKMQAVQNCAKAGAGVVLVPTVAAANLPGLGAIVDFAAQNMPAVRGVHFQPLSYFGRYAKPPAAGSRVTVPALLAALEAQTEGRVKAADFSPGSAEHTLCTFHADYTVGNGRWTAKPAAGGCCGGAAQSSARAQSAVAAKWSAPAFPPPLTAWKGGSRYNLDALDSFLEKRATQTLALSGMAFQDAWTLDLQRLARCHVHVVSPAGTLVPFCAYNLTSSGGNALYRE